MPIIEVCGVSKRFGDRLVLNDVSLSVEPGEMVCVGGASGAGKTTLLRLITRELQADSGTLRVYGVDLRRVRARDVSLLRRSVAVVPQHGGLLSNRSVGGNVVFALSVLGWSASEAHTRTREVLSLVGLLDRMGDSVAELSGGERHRVAVARSLAVGPRVLLADEPTGNLDPESSEAVMRAFAACAESGCAVVIASHDERVLHNTASRTVRLENGVLIEEMVKTC